MMGTLELPNASEREFGTPLELPVTKVQRVIRDRFAISALASEREEDGPYYKFRFNAHRPFQGLPLCFFSRSPLEDDRGRIREARASNRCNDDSSDASHESVSPAFDQDGSRYGSFLFECELHTLVRHYKEELDLAGRIAMYELGTQVFQREYAHAVLICQSGDERASGLRFLGFADGANDFQECEPNGAADYEPFTVSAQDGKLAFTWTLTAASRYWEGLEFAFLQPQGRESALGFPVAGDSVQVRLVTRITPVIPPERRGGHEVPVQTAAGYFLNYLIKQCLGQDREAPISIHIPSTFRDVYQRCWKVGVDHVIDLASYTIGTSFATADGVMKHLRLKNFLFPLEPEGFPPLPELQEDDWRREEARREAEEKRQGYFRAAIVKFFLERHCLVWR